MRILLSVLLITFLVLGILAFIGQIVFFIRKIIRGNKDKS